MKRMKTLIVLFITLSLVLSVTASFATSQKVSKKDTTEIVDVKKIDINTADKEKLAQIPGIGPKKAEAIEKYLKDHGNLKSLDELLNVKGIGPKILAKITPYITI